MIIYGWRGITSTSAKGLFNCPHCAAKVNFKRKQVRRWFTLYFIPVLPLNFLGDYVECQKCMGTYQADVLVYDPEHERKKFEAAYQRGIKHVMVQMMVADGSIAPEEMQLLRGVYRSVANQVLTDEEVQAELNYVTTTENLSVYLKQLGATLNDHGKGAVLKAAILVAGADGSIAAKEQELLGTMADALGVSRDTLTAQISEVMFGHEHQASA
jgi:uncharacterized tellurite resistance protein B-like protein